MVKSSYLKILNSPLEIKGKESIELSTIIQKYPYFQSARALYLKTLKDEDSFKYNNELKKTAAYTTDRTVLFNFITSKIFNTKNVSLEKEKIVDLNFKDDHKENIDLKKDLEIGKPLSFTKSESFSFNQWLQLSTDSIKIITENKSSESKTLQDDIIDRFITNSPKISRVNKNAIVNIKSKEDTKEPLPMTETLAKIYLEQKKYDNAIKAYEILSLKYPEKSGFFADQIKKVRILQKS